MNIIIIIINFSSVHTLRGHEAELSNCIWNFPCNRKATSSLDKTVKIWDLRKIRYPEFSAAHNDEVLITIGLLQLKIIFIYLIEGIGCLF